MNDIGMWVRFPLQQSIIVYFTLTAVMETLSWEARGNGAYLRERQNPNGYPKIDTSNNN
jgi:hypothetical protein